MTFISATLTIQISVGKAEIGTATHLGGATGVHVGVDLSTFHKFTSMIDALQGKQTDWGCWVARLKKEEIEGVLSDLGVTGLGAETLEDGKMYGLVVLEG